MDAFGKQCFQRRIPNVQQAGGLLNKAFTFWCPFTSLCSSPATLPLKFTSPHGNTQFSNHSQWFAVLQTHSGLSNLHAFPSPAYTPTLTLFPISTCILTLLKDSASFSGFPLCFREHLPHCIGTYAWACLPLSLYNFSDFVIIRWRIILGRIWGSMLVNHSKRKEKLGCGKVK